jgi:hypothetical protein
MPRKRKQQSDEAQAAQVNANVADSSASDTQDGADEPLFNAADVGTLVLVNDDTGDTLMLDMQSGEGVFLQGGTMAEIVVDDSDQITDEDVDLDFGRRDLDADEGTGWALPDVVGWLEERLLPAEAARHSRNLRRELLLATRSLLDAALRGMERSDVEDYSPASDDDGEGLNLPRRRPNLRGATAAKRGPQRIELD